MQEPEDEFERYVAQALERVPEPFASQLGSVAIVIDEEATPDQLHRLRVPGLFGLYEGVPRTSLGADAAPLPSKITLFRRPLEMFHRGPEALERAVEETLLHEIAHHFGISDARLTELAREKTGRT